MTAIENKAAIYQYLENLNDPKLLAGIKAFLESYIQNEEKVIEHSENPEIIKEKTFEVFGKKLSKKEYIEFLDESSAQVDRGEFYTIDEAIKESEKW